MSLSKKLTFGLVLSITISIFITSIISNIRINRRFDLFLIKEQKERFERVREDINQLFIEKGHNLKPKDISNYASSEGIYLEIKDSWDNLICRSNNKSLKGLMGAMMKGHHGMKNPVQANKGNYIEKAFPLLEDDEIVATLVIGYIDNSYMTDSAALFKSTLTTSFLISGLITIILGLIASIYLSKGLTKPLVHITDIANQMRRGNLESRSQVNTNTWEVLELSNSINYLAETLKKQEDLRNRYAADISHELRTPLTTLKSHVEAIMDGVWQPDYEHLSILMEEIDGLNKLVDDLRNTFRGLEGRLNLNKTRFSISEELENIAAGFDPVFEKNGYKLDSTIEEDVQISMDRNKLKQVIYNILSNALKYLNDGGNVLVKLEDGKENIKIIIQDNGVGIKDSDLPFIFERFYRADTSRNKETGGTGLGLAIAKFIIEAHGGSIGVDSKFGQGTIFTILLPKNL